MVCLKTPKQFYEDYVGKQTDVDGMYSSQCWDLWAAFWDWAGLDTSNANRNTNPSGYARSIWEERVSHKLALYFDFVTGSENFKTGDWVIWPCCTYAPLSHVAMYYGGKAFGQRQSGHWDATLQNASFDQAYGALRWKDWNTNNDNYKSGGGEVSEKGNDLKQVNAQDTEASTRKIATSFHVYCKNDKKPQMTLKTMGFEGSKIYAVQIKVDENVQICTSYAPNTEWLCKMHSDYMLQHDYKEIACCNAGYFEMSGNVGKPVGAVLKDWEGKWSKWNDYECVPGKGNGYPTLCWDDVNMTLEDQNADKFDLSKYHWCQGVGQSLVIDGKVNCNVGNTNGRYSTANNATAIGFNEDTKILTLMANVKSDTGDGKLNTLQRAYVMKGLGCTLAVQLDGGGSTQLEWLESELSADDSTNPAPDNPADNTDKDKLITALTAENKKLSGIISSIKSILKGVE